MRILRLDCRMTVASLALVCLSASGSSLLPVESTKPGEPTGDQSTGQGASIQVCRDGKLELAGTGQQGQAFQFRCLAGAKLSPVEDPAEARSTPDVTALKKVNVFNLANGQKACNTEGGALDVLVPGSALRVTEISKRLTDDLQVSNLVYTLTLGDAPAQEQHLCYICKAPAAGGHGRQSDSSAQQPCTIYVTVPAKQEPDNSQRPDPKPDEQTGENPNSKPDNPSDSASPSLPVFGGLMLCVAGSVLELMVYL